MTEKSFKFALKTHAVPSKSTFDLGARTDRSLASFSAAVAKPAVRLSSSPIPLKQRKKQPGQQSPAPYAQPRSHLPTTAQLRASNTSQTLNSEAGMVQNLATGLVGESLTARELKFAKQVKTYKSENKRLMQLLKDSQRVLHEKLADSRKENEKVMALFHKLQPALASRSIAPHKLLQALQKVLEAQRTGTPLTTEETTVQPSKPANAVVTSNSANSTTLTNSEFQSTLMEALEQQKHEYQKEKTLLILENARLRSERDALAAHVRSSQQNRKFKDIENIEGVLAMRRDSRRAAQKQQDEVPSFMKATFGFCGKVNKETPSASAAIGDPRGSTPDLGSSRQRQNTTAFLEALSHAQGENIEVRKSKTLGMNPSSSLGKGHLLQHNNNYHLSHLHHASPYRAEEMSPIQQRMMHYYHPLTKGGRSPKP